MDSHRDIEKTNHEHEEISPSARNHHVVHDSELMGNREGAKQDAMHFGQLTEEELVHQKTLRRKIDSVIMPMVVLVSLPSARGTIVEDGEDGRANECVRAGLFDELHRYGRAMPQLERYWRADRADLSNRSQQLSCCTAFGCMSPLPLSDWKPLANTLCNSYKRT